MLVAAKSLQSCPTLCNPTDGSPPASPDPGILQARTLEWVAISFSNAWKWKVKVKSLSHVRPSATPWTSAYQVPLSMGFSRQEYWSGVPLPSPPVVLTKKQWKTVDFRSEAQNFITHSKAVMLVSRLYHVPLPPDPMRMTRRSPGRCYIHTRLV